MVDNDTITDGPGRKVAKIKPFIDLILKNVLKSYTPNQKFLLINHCLGGRGFCLEFRPVLSSTEEDLEEASGRGEREDWFEDSIV